MLNYQRVEHHPTFRWFSHEKNLRWKRHVFGAQKTEPLFQQLLLRIHLRKPSAASQHAKKMVTLRPSRWVPGLGKQKKYVDHDLNGSTTWNWASKGWCQKFGQKCSNLDGKLLCWCLSPGRQTNGPWPKNPNDKKNQKIAVSLSFFQGAKMINPHPFPLIFKTTRNHGVELYAFILAPVSWYLIAIGGMVCVFGLSKLVSSFPTQQLLASLGFS